MTLKILQTILLGACFTAQAHGALAMPGMRRALQTMELAECVPTKPHLAGWTLGTRRL